MKAAKTIHREQHHFGWDRSLPPVAWVSPGEAVEFEVVDASGGQLSKGSTVEDVRRLDFSRVNPVTGPVYIEGAEPGDALVVEIVELVGSGWGWTAIIPGFGLLAEDFPEPRLHFSEYTGDKVEFLPGVVLPFRPFPGTIGVALAAPGLHSVVPPREVGGNLDIRDLVQGARLFLPIQVPGGLFSVGDTHAAQGDGEVCGTAVESLMRLVLKFDLLKGASLPRPAFETPGPGSEGLGQGQKGYFVTTGIGPDLMMAAKDAVRYMIDHMVKEYSLAPEVAYMLCSVAVDLRISEIVDAPNWVVSAYLPKGIFM
ncbi:acetamidase [Thermus scotoductus]|uniref:Acetamidase n=1 Tax=Thermus scotoductus TaxID=37636 RepID=A0A430SI88_THESC|nr:acetamidase/formamidase family protein [Thermus scotoductus]RTH40333.1 acetamidase [Thermus scotoductus]